MLKPWNIDPAQSQIERAVVYTFHSSLATRWRRGRLLLAGDSAHQMPPFLGQGMCSGLRDVANLAWKLRDVIQRRAPDSLLDSYETERMEHVRAYIELAVELGGMIQTTDPDKARQRDARTARQSDHAQAAGAAPGPGSAWRCAAARPARAPSSRGWPTAGDSTITSAIALRCWRRRRLSMLPDASRVTARTASRRSSADGEAADYLAGLGADAVVIRPDRHILGVASTCRVTWLTLSPVLAAAHAQPQRATAAVSRN